MKSPREITTLTIDRGNSSVKAVVWKGDEPVRSVRLFELSIEDLVPVLDGEEIDLCVYCCVGHSDAKFLETLRRLVDGRLLILTPSTPLPIGVEYGSRETLGADRVAAACGAAMMFPGESVIVVDAGTAVTIDVLHASRGFIGGNIAPGMALRLASLHDATERLPLVAPEGDVPRFGQDTVTAIRAGVVGGMASEIADAFQAAKTLYGCSRVILTGNDAPVLYPLLFERGLPVAVCHDLVGLGLLSLSRHNIP